MRYVRRIRLWKGMPKFCKKYIKGKVRKDDYVSVYFFDTEEEMYAHSAKYFQDTNIDYAAKTRCFKGIFVDEDDDIVDYSTNCGQMLFCLDKLGVTVVSHEVAHTVIGYFNRRIEEYRDIFVDWFYTDNREKVEFLDANDIEELFAYMTGNLNDQIWEFYFKVMDKKEGK